MKIAIATGENPIRGMLGGNAPAIGIFGNGAAGIPIGCGRVGAVAGWRLIIALVVDITMSITITLFRAAPGYMSMGATAIATMCHLDHLIILQREYPAETASNAQVDHLQDPKQSPELWRTSAQNIG